MIRHLMSAHSALAISLFLLFYGSYGARESKSDALAETAPRSAKTRPPRNREQQAGADDATDADYLGRLEIAAREAGAKVLSTGDSGQRAFHGRRVRDR